MFLHHNTLFFIFAVTDKTGNFLERYQYEPYGNQTVMDASFNVLTNSTIGQEFTYTGQRFDTETSLYYYKNRYYSPNQGRLSVYPKCECHAALSKMFEYSRLRSLRIRIF